MSKATTPRQGDLYEMIPGTHHGLQSLACVSAMQKCIRRGMEREAMAFAVELIHTSKAFCTMVTNRLEIISHEDIDTGAQPWIVPFVQTACQQARDGYDPKRLGKSRMPIGNAIRMMCRAAKSREGDHFQAAVGLANEIEGKKPEIPDWAYDQHTAQGRRMGRGLKHFFEDGAKLVPQPKKDAYEDEAIHLWKLKHGED